ncbi:hypothetical protein ES332_D06G083600v1 [Gossypium tomentosum]|uniref:Uncharacterized protein n=1 Tax=Gossypium tomentosum TaxID=34277 RepID=A0A5D2KGC5_GOSTO|nr:hypothetical protein ES332_D06G083600v1 [Gossypium tomentosum]
MNTNRESEKSISIQLGFSLISSSTQEFVASFDRFHHSTSSVITNTRFLFPNVSPKMMFEKAAKSSGETFSDLYLWYTIFFYLV